jgi:hypothetical protein
MICQWLILLTCPPVDASSVVDPHFEDCLVFCSEPKCYVAASFSSLLLSQPSEFWCSKDLLHSAMECFVAYSGLYLDQGG